MPTRLIGCERWYSPARLFAEVRQLLFTALTLACLVPVTIVHAQEALINLPDRPLGIHPAGVQEQLAIRLTLAFSSDRFVRNQHGTN